MHEAPLIRVTLPEKLGGTSYIIPAANRGTYQLKNAALLKGRSKGHDRPDLVYDIEDLSPAEHREYYDKIINESREQSAAAIKIAKAEPKKEGVSEAVVLALMEQNNKLMQELAELKKGQQNGKREKAK